jgi:hypothetical protein
VLSAKHTGEGGEREEDVNGGEFQTETLPGLGTPRIADASLNSRLAAKRREFRALGLWWLITGFESHPRLPAVRELDARGLEDPPHSRLRVGGNRYFPIALNSFDRRHG